MWTMTPGKLDQAAHPDYRVKAVGRVAEGKIDAQCEQYHRQTLVAAHFGDPVEICCTKQALTGVFIQSFSEGLR